MTKQRPRYKKSPEQQLQETLITLIKLKLPGVLYCASAGGMHTSKSQAIKMKAAGYVAGFPDLFFYEPRNGKAGLAIELKTEKGSAQPSQKQWQKDLIERGYEAHICKGLDACAAVIGNYFNTRII